MSDNGKSRKTASSTETNGAEANMLTSQALKLGTHTADPHVVRDLKALYKDKLVEIERSCKFNTFHHPEILDAELAAKPTLLLIGQYSTGKTTFIRHLIGMDYPEIHIGPEPTTDRFIAVVYGDEKKTIKGNALTGVNDLPFSGLSTFGSSFLNKFSAAVVPAPLLNHMNIIDTPGVLSGEKQRTARGYDFAHVSRWFAERSDLILLMFDCSKLDISDEFKLVIEELQPHEDKVHCVLNKADQLDTESLMRVYGALLWSMGRIFKGAEVSRIYVGSFQDEQLLRDEHVQLFNKDEQVLKSHLAELPKACSMRKVNEIVKRIRLCVVHLCVLGHLRSRMPYFWGANHVQTMLIDKLDEVFEDVRRTYQLSEGDFPRIEEFRAKLQMEDFYSFPKTDRKTLQKLQILLTEDIPYIISQLAGVPDTSMISTSDEGDGEEEKEQEVTPRGGAAEGKGRGGGRRSFNAKYDAHADGNEENIQQPKIFTITETDSEFQVAYYFLGAFVTAFVAIVGLLYFAQFREDPLGTLFTLLKSFLQALLTNFIRLAEFLAGAAKSSLESTETIPPIDGAGAVPGTAMNAAGASANSAAAAAMDAAKSGIAAAAAAAGVKNAVDSLAGEGGGARPTKNVMKKRAVKPRTDSENNEF